jgi:hypothetical protein
MTRRSMIVIATLSLVACSAAAQDREARARERFAAGVEAARDARWEEAVAAFTDSRDAYVRPATLYNLAVALRELDRFGAAYEAVRAYLARAAPDDASFGPAAQLCAELERVIARVRLSIWPPDARIDGASVTIDGEGGERELAMDPGAHTLSFSAAGHRASTLAVRVRAGELHERRVELAVLRRTARAPRSARDATPWILVGIGSAVAIGGAIAIGVGAADVAAVDASPEGTAWRDVAFVADRGLALEIAGASGVAVGLIVAGAALVWGLARDGAVELAIGATTIDVRGAW